MKLRILTAAALITSLGFTLEVAAMERLNHNTNTQLMRLAQSSDGSRDRTNASSVKVAEVNITNTGVLLGVIVSVDDLWVGVDAKRNCVNLLPNVISANTSVEYYQNSTRLKRIGNFSFIYDAGNQLGKISQIGNLNFAYEIVGNLISNFVRIGNLSFSYEQGKIKRLSNVYFDYDTDGRIQRIRGEQPEVRIKITSSDLWRKLLGMPKSEKRPGDDRQATNILGTRSYLESYCSDFSGQK